MNILVIGNGFDLEHELPTRYIDFLNYCAAYPQNDNDKLNHFEKELVKLTEGNIWSFYLQETSKNHSNEPHFSYNWIDFEKEIAEIINDFSNFSFDVIYSHTVDNQEKFCLKTKSKDIPKTIRLLLLNNTSTRRVCHNTYEIIPKEVTNTNSFIDFLYSQLCKFTRAFEIYCINEVNNISINTTINSKIYPFECVLSFNFTNTFERLYGKSDTQYCVIYTEKLKKMLLKPILSLVLMMI
jgi:hypothetical protein